ncbi:MAG: hypothetical protein ACRCWY_04520, partial [Cellulosilyticaceae bacterium]
SSVVVNGKLDAPNHLRLFKTDLEIKEKSKIDIIYNKSSETDDSKMQLALIFQEGDKASEVTYIDIPNANKKTNGWETTTIDLSPYKGKTIATIGMAFENNKKVIEDYQMNIGGIVLTDGEKYTPNQPTGFEVNEVFTTGEITVKWDREDYEKVQLYKLSGITNEGKEVFLGGVYDENYYIKPLINGEEFKELRLVAVGKDGSESKPAVIKINQEEYLQNIVVKEEVGALNFEWQESKEKVDEVHIEVVLDNASEKVYKTTVKANMNKASIAVPENDGSRYTATFKLVKNKKQLKEVTVSGRLVDTVIDAYEGTFHPYNLKGDFVRMTTPYNPDWRHITVYENGQVLQLKQQGSEEGVTKGTRGQVAFEYLPITGVNSIIAVVLEDYVGNVSKPSYFKWDGKISTPILESDVPNQYRVK